MSADEIKRQRIGRLKDDIATKLEEIRGLFINPDSVRLTLLVRAPAYPDGSRDTLVSDDVEIEAVIRAYRMRMTDPNGTVT